MNYAYPGLIHLFPPSTLLPNFVKLPSERKKGFFLVRHKFRLPVINHVKNDSDILLGSGQGHDDAILQRRPKPSHIKTYTCQRR